MALGRRNRKQQEIRVATANLPRSEGHVYHRKVNQILVEAEFHRCIDCAARTTI
jgi:hypothetical protein